MIVTVIMKLQKLIMNHNELAASVLEVPTAKRLMGMISDNITTIKQQLMYVDSNVSEYVIKVFFIHIKLLPL